MKHDDIVMFDGSGVTAAELCAQHGIPLKLAQTRRNRGENMLSACTRPAAKPTGARIDHPWRKTVERQNHDVPKS